MATALPPRELPKREAAAFRSLVKLYDDKNYKKGLKVSESILNSFPGHGETLALRSLILYQSGKKDESVVAIELACKNDPTSHMCWHVYGIIYRGEKNYTKSLECYERAASYDPKNTAVLRDLCQIQLQLRQYSNSIKTRYKLIDLARDRDATQYFHLLVISVCHYLLAQHADALSALDQFDSLPPKSIYHSDHCLSEIFLFRARIMMESPDVSPLETLAYVEKKQLFIKDVLKYKELKARLTFLSGNKRTAMQLYLELLDANPENRSYVTGFVEASGEFAPDVYFDLANKYFNTYLTPILYLESISHDTSAFTDFAREFISKHLKRGLPALFSLLKSICADNKCRNLVCEIAESELARFSQDNAPSASTTAMWSHYFLSQIYDKYFDIPTALFHINSAIDLASKENSTGVPVEILMLKSRIFKHAGDIVQAYEVLCDASKLDQTDRYIGTKCSKYAFRNSNQDAAFNCIKPFLNPKSKDFFKELCELQCIWYIYELALCNLRKGSLVGRKAGLEKLRDVLGYLTDMQDDEYFFHTYCIHKGSLSHYADLLKMGDKLGSSPCFVNTAVHTIQVLLSDAAQLIKNEKMNSIEQGFEKMDISSNSVAAAAAAANDYKKSPQHQKKKSETKKVKAKSAKNARNKGADCLRNSDFDSAKSTTAIASLSPAASAVKLSPLVEASSILTKIEKFSPTDIRLRRLAFQIYIMSKKWLLALREYKRIIQDSPSDSVFETGVLLHTVSEFSATPDMFKEAITKELCKLQLINYNFASFLDTVETDTLAGTLSAIRLHHLAGKSQQVVEVATAWRKSAVDQCGLASELTNYSRAFKKIEECIGFHHDESVVKARNIMISGIKNYYCSQLLCKN